MRRLATPLLIALLLALLAGCASTGGTAMPPLRTEASVDLERYMGRWWVIANVPYFAERGKVATADIYALREDGRIDNTYAYRKAFDKPEKTMKGLATVVPGTNNAQWRIAFWGGIDTQRILPHGTPQEVCAEVRRMFDIMGPGGGYIVASVHNIQPDVPPENVVAMFDAARQCRYSHQGESS